MDGEADQLINEPKLGETTTADAVIRWEKLSSGIELLLNVVTLIFRQKI